MYWQTLNIAILSLCIMYNFQSFVAFINTSFVTIPFIIWVFVSSFIYSLSRFRAVFPASTAFDEMCVKFSKLFSLIMYPPNLSCLVSSNVFVVLFVFIFFSFLISHITCLSYSQHFGHSNFCLHLVYKVVFFLLDFIFRA